MPAERAEGREARVDAERPARRLAWLLVGASTLLLAAAVVHADRNGAAGRTILGFLSAPLDAWIGAGGWLYQTAGAALTAVRLPALVAVAAWLGFSLRRCAAGGPGHLLAACCIGWIAQSYLLDGFVAVGLALYAAAVAATLVRRRAPCALDEALPPARELVALLAVLALFLVVCLYRLEVYPLLYFDEAAYLRAARMQAGSLEGGRIIRGWGSNLYRLEQFRAQALPFFTHTAAVRLLYADIVPLRLVSVVTFSTALLVAVLGVRRHLGSRVALWMGALAALAPLFVAYARVGFYIAMSVLHGAVCVAALLWLRERWNARSALLLGALLGLSLYNYQLSWFVPLLTGMALLATPDVWRRGGVVRNAVLVGASAAAVALPGLVGMRSGFEEVTAQTFDRALWRQWQLPEGVADMAVVVVPPEVSDAELDAYTTRHRGSGLRVRRWGETGMPRILVLSARFELPEGPTAEAEAAGWTVLHGVTHQRSAVSRLQAMLAQLFYARKWESSQRYVDAPLLNPLLAPLLVIGLLEALRRRRAPALRLLAVWVVAGAVLPAVVGGSVPRRALLILPFAHALTALPLLEIRASCRGPRARAAFGVASLALFAAVALTGSHLYFERWDRRPGVDEIEVHALEFLKLLKGLPADQPVLVPDSAFPHLGNYLVSGDPLPDGRAIVPIHEADSAERIRGESCRREPPFVWASQDTPSQRRLFEGLEEDFVHEVEVKGPFLLWRVSASKPGGCADPVPTGEGGRPGRSRG